MTGSGTWRLLSRLAAVGIALVLAAAVILGLGAPYLDWRAQVAGSVEREAALLARYRVLAERGGADPAAADAPADRRLEALLLPAASEGQAMAALQDRLKAMSAAAGLTLVSVQAIAAETGATVAAGGGAPSPLSRLTVRLKLAGDTAQLNRFLFEVERGQPWLLVDNLFVNARSGRAVGPGAGLDVQLDVSGLRAQGNG